MIKCDICKYHGNDEACIECVDNPDCQKPWHPSYFECDVEHLFKVIDENKVLKERLDDCIHDITHCEICGKYIDGGCLTLCDECADEAERCIACGELISGPGYIFGFEDGPYCVECKDKVLMKYKKMAGYLNADRH